MKQYNLIFLNCSDDTFSASLLQDAKVKRTWSTTWRRAVGCTSPTGPMTLLGSRPSLRPTSALTTTSPAPT